MLNLRWVEVASGVFSTLGVGFLCVFVWDPWSQPAIENIVRLNTDYLDFGTVSAFEIKQGKIEISNLSADLLDFRLLADCECMQIEPAMGQIPGLSTQVVKIAYRPIGVTQTTGWRAVDDKEIIINVRNSQIDSSLPMYVHATVIKPFVFDRSKLDLHCMALSQTGFQLDLSVLKGVERLEIVSSPEFLGDIQMSARHPVFDVIKLTGTVKPISTTMLQTQPLVIRAFFKNEEGQASEGSMTSFDLSLPMTLVTELPYALSSEIIEAFPEERHSLSITPGEHLRSLRILEAICDESCWEANVVDSTTVEIFLKSSATVDDQSGSSYLKLVVSCDATETKSQQFNSFVLLTMKGDSES